MPQLVKKAMLKQKKYTHVGPLEARLIQNMLREGLPWDKVRKITGRGNGAAQTI